jgi:hypothetical protein
VVEVLKGEGRMKEVYDSEGPSTVMFNIGERDLGSRGKPKKVEVEGRVVWIPSKLVNCYRFSTQKLELTYNFFLRHWERSPGLFISR